MSAAGDGSRRRRIDFVLSNPRHHLAMVLPVARRLAERPDLDLRVVSLCEFRGLPSPAREFESVGVPLERLAPFRLRSSPVGAEAGPPLGSRRREWARSLVWRLWLWPGAVRVWRILPDLAVLMNDAAFPYDRIVARLARRQVPFLLLQEGIRYALPESADVGSLGQGRGGARAIAAWGPSSGEYYESRGNSPDVIHLTGNPVFDSIAEGRWAPQAEKVASRLGLRGDTLLFLSNPIEDHGYCSAGEKLELVARFLDSLGPLCERPGFRIVVKLHSQESESAFRERVGRLPHADRVEVLTDTPLYPLLAAVEAAVVLSSTAGLEALLFDRPLGVLEVPGAGFLHDYVAGGAAAGLAWDESMPDQVRRLLDRGAPSGDRVERYLARHLAVRSGAAERVSALILGLLDPGLAPLPPTLSGQRRRDAGEPAPVDGR